MRVLLVTLTDQLSGAFSILNPELEYRAIFVDEVAPAKKILERVGLPQDLLHPFYELRELSKTCYYDALVCVHDGRTYKMFPEKILKYGIPQNKFIDLFNSTTHEYFLLERALQYFKERATEFEMFATGLSHTTMSLDVTRFKRKLFNFARGGQDLYYDFQIAKRAVLYGGGIEEFFMHLSVFLQVCFTLTALLREVKIGDLLNTRFLLATYIIFGCLQKNI